MHIPLDDPLVALVTVCLVYFIPLSLLLCVREMDDDDGGGQQYLKTVAVTKASILKIDDKATKSKESQQ